MIFSCCQKKNSMQDIFSIKNVGRHCVSNFFNAWEKATSIEEKMACLRIKKGRGTKLKLASVESEIPRLLEKHSRNLNAVFI